VQKIVRRFILSLDGNPIYYRTDSDDPEIIDTIFVRDEYGCLGEEVKDPKLIVDCGAYAGYSTLYFLARYRPAQIIALEPDERNYELCRRNLEPYSDRVTLIKAALWPVATQLALHENAFAGVQQEWATLVTAPNEHESAPVTGLDYQAVLARAAFHDVDLFKMNCSGMEESVFSTGSDTWLPRVKNIVIRLVDEASENVFFKALAGFQYYLARGPGVFACTRIAAKDSAPLRDAPRAGDEMLSNGGFEEARVEPGHIVPGGWIYGSSDIALDWHTVVCDPQFRISVAIRTGLQHSGENALCVRLNDGYPVLPQSSPYVAIENRKALPISEGERWSIRAFVKADGAAAPKTRTRGAYTFLRVFYDDGSYNDLRTLPIFEPTGEYVEIGGVVEVPLTPAGRRIERATLWLYVWIENHELDELPASAYGRWTVFFDDASCRKVSS
jgi:FkbM family methyltransferase